MFNKGSVNKSFPNLIDFDIYPNTESEKYNCISYSLGLWYKWSWPTGNEYRYWPIPNKTETKKAFDEFYLHHGYSLIDINNIGYESGYTKVALFVKDNIPKHAAIQLDNTHWESKMGFYEIIKHKLNELEGGIYGNIIQLYSKKIL